MVLEDFPPHSSSSLLGEGSGSLKDQSHCLNLRKNLKGSPEWWQSWNSGIYGVWRSWVWLGFPYQLCFLCSVVGVAGMRPTLVLGIVVWVASVGEVASAGWGVTMLVGCVMVLMVMGLSIGQRVAQVAVVVGWGAWCVSSETVAPVTVGMVAWLWMVGMTPMSVTIVGGVWSVPLSVGILIPWMRSVLVVWCLWGRNLVGAVLCKVAKFIAAVYCALG